MMEFCSIIMRRVSCLTPMIRCGEFAVVLMEEPGWRLATPPCTADIYRDWNRASLLAFNYELYSTRHPFRQPFLLLFFLAGLTQFVVA